MLSVLLVLLHVAIFIVEFVSDKPSLLRRQNNVAGPQRLGSQSTLHVHGSCSNKWAGRIHKQSPPYGR